MTFPSAPRVGAQITAWLRTKMAEGYHFPEGTCLMQMHLAAGLPYGHDYTPGNGHDPWAIEAFDHSPTAVHQTDPAKVPAEVYVYFRSRRPGRPGHIAWDPHGGAGLLGTDYPKTGQFGESDIPAIERAWGMDLVGYDRCLNGHRMSEEPAVRPKPPKPHKPLSRGANIDAAISRLIKARAANAKYPGRRAKAKVKQIDVALAALHKIPEV